MRTKALISLTLLLVLAGCYNSFRMLQKYPDDWTGKQVKVRGKVIVWWPTDRYGFYIIVLQSLKSERKIAVYTQVPHLKAGEELTVAGTFYKDGTLLKLGYDLVVDSAVKNFEIKNPAKYKFERLYGEYPPEFFLRLKPRYNLPLDCSDTLSPDTTTQNSF